MTSRDAAPARERQDIESLRERFSREPPALIAVDLDGTCIDGALSFHPDTQRALSTLARTIPVIVATGRMYCSALPWARRFGVTDPLICYQGAFIKTIRDGDEGTVLFEKNVPSDVLIDTLSLARDHGWHRQLYVDDTLYCEEDRKEARIYADRAGVSVHIIPDLDEFAGRSTKVAIVEERYDEATRALALLREALGDRARVVRSLRQLVEVSDPRASKGQALSIVARHLRLSERGWIVFGDAPNDIDMFDAAEVAVASGTTDPDVLAHATFECPGPTQGGVAAFLADIGVWDPQNPTARTSVHQA